MNNTVVATVYPTRATVGSVNTLGNYLKGRADEYWAYNGNL